MVDNQSKKCPAGQAGTAKAPQALCLRGFCYDANRFSGKSLNLALDTAGTVATGQLLDLGDSDHVVVALDGVLQGRSSNSELNSVLRGLAVQQGIDCLLYTSDAADD